MSNGSWPGSNWCPDLAEILTILRDAAIESAELVPSGSNYVFAVRLNAGEAGKGLGIYKPRRGEAPLWDYPNGDLYKREAAAYVVCEAVGWSFVPPTVIRDGPHGVGTVQLYIEHDPRQTFFSLRDQRSWDMQRMAAYDAAVNNGDRKGGHCLLGVDGRIWGIDHGLTFHSENKLRTVIWDYAGDPIPEPFLADLRRLAALLESGSDLREQLRELLTPQEIGAFRQRIERLLSGGRFPTAGYRRSVPWPPV